MATVQVRHIVDDVEAAIAFYTRHLGFRLEMHPAPPFAMLSRGDLRLDFHRCFQVMEAENETLPKEWIDHWADLVDFEVVPVRTSEEAARAIAPEV